MSASMYFEVIVGRLVTRTQAMECLVNFLFRGNKKVREKLKNSLSRTLGIKGRRYSGALPALSSSLFNI